MDLLHGSKSEDVWTPYKELLSIVDQYVSRPTTGSYATFESALRRHRQNFLAILKNLPKNALSREEIKVGASSGVSFAGCGHTILPQQLVDETIIISDMYDLNEYLALELLCTAQRQMPANPGLPRGLVAVLLYYDGRKSLVQALKNLVTARRGVSWSTDASEEIVDYVTSYTDRLVTDGIVTHILEVLETWDLNKEMEMLQNNRALGGPKHRRQIWRLLTETRGLLASTLVSWGAQGGLTREPVLKLVGYLRRCPADPDSSGAIDNTTLALMMAFLYAIDLSVIHRREDGEELVQTLPIMKDIEFVSALCAEFSVSHGNWKCEGLQAIALLAWSLCLAGLRLTSHVPSPPDNDEALADTAINMKVFEYLHETFLLNENIHKEEFYMKRMHTLITDFIVLMHSKLTDLRLKAEEAARTAQQYAAEGLEVPAALPRHFEALLLGVARLYSKDHLNLRLQYWAAPDPPLLSTYRGSARGISLVKFVRSAGSLAPTRVLAPWARACAALASGPGAAARAHALLHPPSAPLSWEHLFSSLDKYYTNLRQECGPIGLLSNIGGMKRAVRADEVNALRAALELVRAVAAHDASARQAICDHPNWAAVPVLIGLVGCSIPIALKADLVLTLGSLGMSPETAIYIWNSIESAQLICTIPSASSYQPCGVETELEEVEARNEEFPLTRALLELFDILSTSGIPRTLGAGPRKPGFDPYLTFIINSVFLKFHTRSYKNPEEKWQIACFCLALFEKFINQYEPCAADFPLPLKLSEVNPPPGLHILLQMNTKSDFLRLILCILDESVALLDNFQPFPGKKYLEDSALSCLKLLEKALLLQHNFMAELANSGCSILVIGLNKLLLGVNPRSGKPDHMLNIIKFVTYNSWLQKHALASVNILSMIATQPTASQHLISMLTTDANLRMEIRHGFIECLEANETTAPDEEIRTIIIETKEAILNLLQVCLFCMPPNLSHYLLGFDLSKDISKTAFHQPGIMGFPRTCLHSIIGILDSAISTELWERVLDRDISPGTFDGNLGPLEEGAYKLLYYLCSKQNTMGPILRYLRACGEFIPRHISALKMSENADSEVVAASAWLLKLCAIELHVLASERQTSHFTTLTKQLVDSPDKVEGGGALLRLLPALSQTPESPEEPRWRLLDASALAAARKACSIPNTDPSQIYNSISVSKLRALLATELSAPLRPAAPHRSRLLHEIEEALNHAVALNQWGRACSARAQLISAWRAAAEALCCCGRAPAAAAPLLRALLSAPTSQLADKVTGTVLILLVSLRHGFITERRQSLLCRGNLEPTLMMPNTFGSHNTLNLKFILQKILNWMLISNSSSQKMRVNLYGAFLNFMRIVNSKSYNLDEILQIENDSETTYISRLDSTRSKINKVDDSSLKSAVLEAVADCGDALRDCISTDATGSGHEVCKVAALVCLEELVSLEPGEHWLKALQTTGHLRNLIDSLLKDDVALRQVLEITPKTMKSLFVYESKMSLLNRIASTRLGAELLLQQGALTCLANMRIFDSHPDMQNGMEPSRDFIPSVANRYRQIIIPALAFCDALITTLGSENHSCLVQIIHFLLSHSETVESILRAGGPTVSLDLLIELEALTSVVARSSNQEIFGSVENDSALQGSVISVYRIQKLMLALFPRFILTESLLKDISENFKLVDSEFDSSDESVNRVSIYFKILSNLVCYGRNITANHGIDHGSIGVIFRPVLSSGGLDRRGQWANPPLENTPHLGIMVQTLVNSVMHFNKEKIVLELLVRKLRNVPDMSIAELEDLVSSEIIDGSLIESKLTACEKLSAKVKEKRKEMEYIRYVIDNCLYLVWAHLEFYMLKALPINGQMFTNGNTGQSVVLSAAEASFQSSSQDIADLKHGLVSVFNETFCRQLMDTAIDKNPVQKGYLEALIRKIKCLLQFVPVD